MDTSEVPVVSERVNVSDAQLIMEGFRRRPGRFSSSKVETPVEEEPEETLVEDQEEAPEIIIEVAEEETPEEETQEEETAEVKE